MQQALTRILNNLLSVLGEDARCLGGWQFGSASRGMADEYSDIDAVFLIDGPFFEEFDRQVASLARGICDEVVCIWPEGFNGEAITNYGCVLRLGETLCQFDLFFLNQERLEDWMCKIHYAGVGEEAVLLDKTGVVKQLLSGSPALPVARPDALEAVNTYWFHAQMLVKYLKRRDFCKIRGVLDTLFHAHVQLLLARYDTLPWGGWQSKVSHCVPKEQQKHLYGYGWQADEAAMARGFLTQMDSFADDARQACEALALEYPRRMEALVAAYVRNSLGPGDGAKNLFRI